MASFLNYLIIVMVTSVAAVVCAQPDSLPEKYTKKLLIEAKWGNGPGEFQLKPMNETQTWLTYLTLDKHRNIYIVDPNNYRINIFNKNGSYISTFVLVESDVIEKDKLPPENRGNLIQGIGVDSKGHVFVALSAFGTNSTVLELDKNGKRINKYFFPKAYVENFYLLEDKNDIYLLGAWCVIDNSRYGYQYFYANVPLSLGGENTVNNSIDIVDKIKEISKQTDSVLKDTKFIDGYSGYYSGSGDVAIKDNKGKIIFKEHHSNLIEENATVSIMAMIIFDEEGSFFVVQGKPEGLEVLKYSRY